MIKIADSVSMTAFGGAWYDILSGVTGAVTLILLILMCFVGIALIRIQREINKYERDIRAFGKELRMARAAWEKGGGRTK